MTSLNASLGSIEVNGVTYVPANSNPIPTGDRHVVVIDRGWIFAGNMTSENGDIILTDALHVFRWESIGFTGVLEDPKSGKVTFKTCPYPVKIPQGSVIFVIPVPQDWGK